MSEKLIKSKFACVMLDVLKITQHNTPDTWAKKDKVIASFTNVSVENHNRIIRNIFRIKFRYYPFLFVTILLWQKSPASSL